jgi:sortase A
MRVLMERRPLRRILLWTQRSLFACAFLTLGYCGYVMADTWMFQRDAGTALTQLVADNPATAAPHAPALSASTVKGLVGRIDIARLGLSVVVMEGTSSNTLRHAVGHIPGTARPGEAGNVGIAGHRDTLFRPLRNVRPNDVIVMTTPDGQYQYRVVSAKVVDPDDVSVLESDGSDILTLVTCYPFYFVGPAPGRFIVRAEKVI